MAHPPPYATARCSSHQLLHPYLASSRQTISSWLRRYSRPPASDGVFHVRLPRKTLVRPSSRYSVGSAATATSSPERSGCTSSVVPHTSSWPLSKLSSDRQAR